MKTLALILCLLVPGAALAEGPTSCPVPRTQPDTRAGATFFLLGTLLGIGSSIVSVTVSPETARTPDFKSAYWTTVGIATFSMVIGLISIIYELAR